MHKDNLRIFEIMDHPDYADFCRENNIRLAILFGSRVTGRARDESDFDLAVMFDSSYPNDIFARGKIKRSLIRKLATFFSSSRIDLVIINDASSFLIYHVTQTGKVLYEADQGEFANLASLAIRQYSDGQLFREAEKQYLFRKV